ncbi:MAG: hypothetical protein ACR2QW_11925 [bacterium]
MKNSLERLADRSTLQLVCIFVVLDAIALLCAWLFTIDVLESRFFKLGRDRGIGELFEYGKFALIIYMLLHAWRETGHPVIRAWVILFCIMLADNLIGIHEEVGELIVNSVDLPDLGLKRPKDLAEIIVLALLEGTALLYVGWCYLQSNMAGRQFSHGLMAIIAVFIFFALGMDAVGPQLLEEPGEMLGMTLIMAWLHKGYRASTTAT